MTRRIWVIVALTAGIVLGIWGDRAAHPLAGRIPSCAEDEVVIGAGDFADGRWDLYLCMHPDRID